MDGIQAGEEARHPVSRVRRHWTAEDKRRILVAVRQPGAVKREVARRHGVCISLVNRWQREEGQPSAGDAKQVNAARLLPVQVSTTRSSRSPTRKVLDAARVEDNLIEVQFSAGQRLLVRGVVDGAVLRTVLAELSQC